MKKLVKRATILAVLVAALAFAAPAQARTEAGDLGLGGDFVFGGATKYAAGGDGAGMVGIEPLIQFFVIDNLSIWTRVLWERYIYDGVDVDVFPLLFGARYYFDLGDLKPFAGAGLGGAFWQTKVGPFTASDEHFALSFHGGVEYEVMDNLSISGTFDIFLPNVAPNPAGAEIVARFGIMAGVMYYLPVL